MRRKITEKTDFCKIIPREICFSPCMLPNQDSNPDRQNQNL